MFFKALELNGFKSFAQKTVLEFPTGITVIVGPNGSGKSNIIDAVRWLLGEKEAKNLRGLKIDDLIWNGSPKRPRMSLAQVSMRFDNSANDFPVDFQEIVIKRQVGRDGLSKYFLNQNEVRLKDVVDFFSKSRLGTKGLTIISQGSSDVFVRVSPEERRLMIEEILGLREYQLKKNEAEKKLKNTFVNLEKVKAVISEVLPRLRLLKRQTSRWAKRAELLVELKQLEENYFAFRFAEIDCARKILEPKLNVINSQIFEKEKELNVLEVNFKQHERQSFEYAELRRIKDEKNALLIDRSKLQKDLGRLEAQLEFLASSKDGDVNQYKYTNQELVSFLREVVSVLETMLEESDLEHLKDLVSRLLNKVNTFLHRDNQKQNSSTQELNQFVQLRDNLLDSLQQLDKRVAVLEAKELTITTNLENFNKQLEKSLELIDDKRIVLGKLKDQRNQYLFELEKLRLKEQDLENQLLQSDRKRRDIPVTENLNYSQEEFLALEKRIARLKTELASIGEIDESLLKEAQDVEAHYNFLTNQCRDLEKASLDLQELIKNLHFKIHSEFSTALTTINKEFNRFFRLMFGGGSAELKLRKLKNRATLESDSENENNLKNQRNIQLLKEEDVSRQQRDADKEMFSGIEIELRMPKKRITSLEMLSGGEKSLVSIAALFALIAVSPPPFLVLDEVDAALDEANTRKFATLIKDFAQKTQFIVVTHNRATMEVADVLYGITMGDDGCSRVLSLKLESA
jgi:chromosome segregation protein